MLRQLEKLLDEKIRPGLKTHNGNVELVDVDNNKVFIKLTGGCQGCMASKMTLKNGIEQIIKKEYPEITEVIDLTDHNAGTNPYYGKKTGKTPFSGT